MSARTCSIWHQLCEWVKTPFAVLVIQKLPKNRLSASVNRALCALRFAPSSQTAYSVPDDVDFFCSSATDPAKGSISHVSPLARALVGKSIGDTIRAGHDDAEIVAIE